MTASDDVFAGLPEPHSCGEGCVCPVHGFGLLYWPDSGLHSCQVPSCEYGRGAVLVEDGSEDEDTRGSRG